MRVVNRAEATAILEGIGVIRDKVHDTGCYSFDPTSPEEALLAIDGFQPEEKESLLRIVVEELLEIRPNWWLVPKYGYFGEQPWSPDEWAALGLPPLNDQVLAWSSTDLPPVDKILTATANAGWNVEWDLYLISSDGQLIAFVDHHELLSVNVRERREAERLSARLTARGVENEVYPPGPEA